MIPAWSELHESVTLVLFITKIRVEIALRLTLKIELYLLNFSNSCGSSNIIF